LTVSLKLICVYLLTNKSFIGSIHCIERLNHEYFSPIENKKVNLILDSVKYVLKESLEYTVVRVVTGVEE